MKVKDLIEVLDNITGGRVVKDLGDVFTAKNPFVVMKSSNIPGKAVMETPGLVYGNPEAEIKKVAVTMTLTEGNIELAGATGVDVIVAHHPIADAANSGGVTLSCYLDLYNISVFELHEAFHGLHPGISYIHGHKPFYTDIRYGGIPGNIMYVGKTLDEIKTLGDILNRLNKMMDMDKEHQVMGTERIHFNCSEIKDSATAVQGEILLGTKDTPVNTILHIFPHTGFTAEHLEKAKSEHPEIDTVLATISRVKMDSDLVYKAKELGLNFICGNSHALEVFENGLPLAYALRHYLPEDVEIVIFRERICSTPLKDFGSATIKDYAKFITENYLIHDKK
ncbi:MAG: NGG1p interacting factor NIF3 [Tepidanaerobacter acetatoxydans]|uniref:Nif3-like dinuclear metal center hexameric protein n=1 Tax=Tepidanaerobacter TaxID=499228 RepID=UPI000B1DCE69|nr:MULTISPECIES: Nif3-like dinuclear metal center hexameric protein [Tepidanaerobacter]NLU11088.1 NGG1p interacting factor NIF3 [Tepidanaerobacter acetatoxydans]